MKSNNIIQLRSCSMHYTEEKFVLQQWGKVLSPFFKQSMQLMYFRISMLHIKNRTLFTFPGINCKIIFL